MGDGRMGMIESTINGVNAIGFLADGQRDDMDRRIGKPRENCLPILVGCKRLDNRTDDPDAVARAITCNDTIKAILGPHILRNLHRAQTDTDNTPASKRVRQRRIGINGLVRAMKSTEADVNNPRLQRLPIVGGRFNQIMQLCPGAQAFHQRTNPYWG